MGRQNVDKENVRSIQKSKRSYYVTLPIALVRALGWKERREVVVEKEGKKLTIKDF